MGAVLAVLLAIALVAAGYFGVRYALLKRALRQANDELAEIVERLEENRIVKLAQPHSDLEALLGTVNRALEGIRRQSVVYARREAELKSQVESISHDLRTPLTAIVGYLALLDEQGMDAATRASLDTVRRKADALQRLIAQFYGLSQVRSGDVRLERVAVDAGRMLREAMAERYGLFERRGLDVRLDIPERPLFAKGDADALERVVENLVHNAGKYGLSRIDAEAHLADGRVVVALANDVDPSLTIEVDRLFEPFYTADAARSGESSGLGLAIARSLMEQMGGTLEARLEERGGSTQLRFEAVLDAVE